MYHGDPDRVAREYHELNFGRLPKPTGEDEDTGSETVVLRSSTPGSRTDGNVPAPWPSGAVLACMKIVFHGDLQDPIFGFRLTNEARRRGRLPHGLGAWPERSFRAGQRTFVRMRLTNLLLPGATRSRPGDPLGVGKNALDIRDDYTSFVVHGAKITGAQADLPYELEIEPE